MEMSLCAASKTKHSILYHQYIQMKFNVCVVFMHINIHLCARSACTCFFKRQQPPRLYPLAPRICVCTESAGILLSQQSGRPPRCVSVCPLILTLGNPSYRVRYQANEMNTHPQLMGFHLKARGINAGPLITRTHRGWGEWEEGVWQGGSPMGCYSNDRFVVKALHAGQKHEDTFQPPERCVKVLYYENMFPAVS